MKRAIWLMALCACDPALAGIEISEEEYEDMGLYQTPTQISNEIDSLRRAIHALGRRRSVDAFTTVAGAAAETGPSWGAASPRPALLTPIFLEDDLLLSRVHIPVRPDGGTGAFIAAIYRMENPLPPSETYSQSSFRAGFKLVAKGSPSGFIPDSGADPVRYTAIFDPPIKVGGGRPYFLAVLGAISAGLAYYYTPASGSTALAAIRTTNIGFDWPEELQSHATVPFEPPVSALLLSKQGAALTP